MSEQTVAFALSTNRNVQRFQWYLEITHILQKLRKKFEESEISAQENFEEKIKNDNKDIFEVIDKQSKKPNKDFIKYILKEHPPKKKTFKRK